MEHEKKDKWRSTGLWIAIVTFTLAFLADIVWVTWTVAQTSARVEQTNSSWKELDVFRVETIKGTATQKEINDALIKQLNALTVRMNRLDKAHKFPPLEWENITVPE